MSLIAAIRQSLPPGPPNGTPSPDDLARINAFAATPLSAEEVFVFAAVMCNRAKRKDLPWSFGDSSLQNFAADADAGIPYLLQHDRFKPFQGGYTYAAHYDPTSGEARAAVYLVRGVALAEPDGINTDQEIAQIEKGLRRNFSINPTGGFMQCDVCKEDVFSARCPHIAGMKDPVTGEVVTATLQEARAVELSGVDNGAVPGTLLLKARLAVQENRLAAAAYNDWLDRYHLPQLSRSLPLPKESLSETPAARGETAPLSGKTNVPDVRDKEARLMRDKLAAALARLGLHSLSAYVSGAKEDDMTDIAERLSAQVRAEVDAQVQAQVQAHPLLSACASAEIKTPEALALVLTQACAGRAYEAAIRADAKAEAVRAKGPEKGAQFAASIDTMPISALEIMRADWKAEADAKLGEPSRVSASAPLPHSVRQEGGDPAARQAELLAMTALGKSAAAHAAKGG